jgi:hypothetical protein
MKDYPIYHCPSVLCSKTFRSTFDLETHLGLDHNYPEGKFVETTVEILVRVPKVKA